MDLVRKAGVIIFVIVLVAAALAGYYATRIMTVASIEKETNYSDWNVYKMDVKYAYDLDSLCPAKVESDEDLFNAIIRQAVPIVPLHIKMPRYGCSAFRMQTPDGKMLMGRSYDFKKDSSAMLVYCHPNGGYRSMAFAAIDNLGVNEADKGIENRLKCLAAPFICLDGINEKGVSIAVLTLDSKPVRQQTGKPKLMTTLLIRLVLDRAASTAEAVELLQKYDMYAIAGRDYHFFISDATGDSRVVEFDCESAERKFVATPTPAVTNFYYMHKDKVLPNQKNGIYGHGRERYDKIMKVMEQAGGNFTQATAWQALQSAAQLPKPDSITSNTQWSAVYNNTDLTAEFALHRRWADKLRLELEDDGVDIDGYAPRMKPE